MDKIQADEYLKVLVSAYVWVASSDDGVDLIEMAKYEHVMVQSQFATQFEATDMRHYFKDMVALFVDEYEHAVELTKMRLKEICGQEHLAQEVIRICRAAVVGDGVIKEAEEVVLAEISAALNIKADF